MAFIPKLPPTKCVITRIFERGKPSKSDTVSWLARTPIVES
jgi:hypothetical protein